MSGCVLALYASNLKHTLCNDPCLARRLGLIWIVTREVCQVMFASGFIEIAHTETEQVIARIASPGVEGYIFGRSDSSSTYLPDIDLAAYDARDKGVSRRHAVLIRYRGMIHILDLNSVNGTFLNGERILPEVPYALNGGDQVMLANLCLTITQITG